MDKSSASGSPRLINTLSLRACMGQPRFILACYRVFHRAGIIGSLGGVEDFQPDDITVLVVIENHTGLVFVTLLYGTAAENHPQDVGFNVVSHLHGSSPVFADLSGPVDSHDNAWLGP